MKRGRMALILMMIAFLLSGCEAAFEAYTAPENKGAGIPAQPKDEFLIWTTDDIVTEQLRFFYKQYPDLQFKVEEVDRIEVIDRYYQALTAEAVPDLLLIPDEYVGLLSELDQFEDLSQSPYYDQAYYTYFPKALLDRYINMKGELYAFPVRYYPYVTFYRHDIFEMSGYPSTPEAFSDFISDSNRYLAMAKKMDEEGYSVYQSNQTLIQDALRVSYPFDENFQYTYNNIPFQDMLNTVAALKGQGINPMLSIGNDYGQTQLKQSELVMVQMPSYGINDLQKWVPEQAGLWRMAKLPFGLTGIDREQSIAALIPKRAEQKIISFKLIRALADASNYEIFSSRTSPMLDQAQLNDFYYDILSQPTKGNPSMLDLYARRHWNNTMFDIAKGAPITQRLFQKTHDQVLDEIRLDQRLLMKEKDRYKKSDSYPFGAKKEDQ